MNVFEEVEPYVRDALLELESPVARLREMMAQLGESTEAMLRLPRQLQQMLDDMQAGESSLSMEIKGLDGPIGRVTSVANRLALAILAAAFVVGPALLIPHLDEIFGQWQAGAFFLVLSGFGLSLLLTLALLVSIWRSGR
jgi:ubiquinone biosynthesis protein